MKTHWKSSESPLYVKVIWRKGLRHVVLFREEHRERVPLKPTSNSDLSEPLHADTTADLEHCLTKLRLKNADKSRRSVSCEPSFMLPMPSEISCAKRPHSVSVCDPDGSYYFVNPHPKAATEAEGSFSQDAFTKRILQWLSTSSISESVEKTHFHPTNNSSCDETNFGAKKRPKTSHVDGNYSKIVQRPDNIYHRNSFGGLENEFSQTGRPQLHIFVPIFNMNV